MNNSITFSIKYFYILGILNIQSSFKCSDINNAINNLRFRFVDFVDSETILSFQFLPVKSPLVYSSQILGKSRKKVFFLIFF